MSIAFIQIGDLIIVANKTFLIIEDKTDMNNILLDLIEDIGFQRKVLKDTPPKTRSAYSAKIRFHLSLLSVVT
jgi:hypothetical protein